MIMHNLQMLIFFFKSTVLHSIYFFYQILMQAIGYHNDDQITHNCKFPIRFEFSIRHAICWHVSDKQSVHKVLMQFQNFFVKSILKIS